MQKILALALGLLLIGCTAQDKGVTAELDYNLTEDILSYNFVIRNTTDEDLKLKFYCPLVPVFFSGDVKLEGVIDEQSYNKNIACTHIDFPRDLTIPANREPYVQNTSVPIDRTALKNYPDAHVEFHMIAGFVSGPESARFRTTKYDTAESQGILIIIPKKLEELDD